MKTTLMSETAIASKSRTPASFRAGTPAAAPASPDRVEGAILDVLREEHCRRKHRQQPGEDRHRPERHVLQHLKLLLEAELHHERRAADDQQGEEQHEVEDLQPNQLQQRIRGDRRDPCG
jgi:hypothetical protein